MLGESVRRRRGAGGAAKRQRPPRRGRGRGARFWAVVALAALGIPFLAGYLVATQVLFPPPAMADAGIPVPELRGMAEAEVRLALVEAGLGGPEVSTLPHPYVAEGLVVAQSPLPGQQLRPGAVVQVAVSSGSPVAPVPDVRGFDAERAALLLERLGYVVERTEVETAIPAGRVVEVRPAPGMEVRVPSTITLVVSLGLPDAEPLGVPWDSLGVRPDTAAIALPDGPGGAGPPADTSATGRR